MLVASAALVALPSSCVLPEVELIDEGVAGGAGGGGGGAGGETNVDHECDGPLLDVVAGIDFTASIDDNPAEPASVVLTDCRVPQGWRRANYQIALPAGVTNADCLDIDVTPLTGGSVIAALTLDQCNFGSDFLCQCTQPEGASIPASITGDPLRQEAQFLIMWADAGEYRVQVSIKPCS